GFAAGGANYALPQQTAPAIAAPEVQRLLNAQNGSPVVTNPAQSRREIAQANRAQTFAQNPHAFAQNRGHNVALRPPLPPQASPTAQMMRGVGRGHHAGNAGVAPVMARPARGNGHGRGHVAAAPAFAQPQVHGNGNGHGNGH